MLDNTLEQELLQKSDNRDILSFLSLVHSYLIRPFERLFNDQLTNLQIITLCLLWQNGPASITEIADRLYLSKQQMAKLIGNLSDRGYIKRYHPSRDRRVVLVELTENTAEMLNAQRQIYAKSLVERIEREKGEQAAEHFLRSIYDIGDILSNLSIGDEGHKQNIG